LDDLSPRPWLRTRSWLLRELLVWAQYFVISLAAASVAHGSAEKADWRSSAEIVSPVLANVSVRSQEMGDINIRGLGSLLWIEFYRPWTYTFLILSVARLSVLLGARVIRQRYR
jgi:hypothetical protein